MRVNNGLVVWHMTFVRQVRQNRLCYCKGNCKLDLAKLAGGPRSILFK